MISNNLIQLGLIGLNSAGTYFFTMPYRAKVKTIYATAQNSDIGDADTVTIYDGLAGTNTVGVATFDSDIAAGAKATYAKNATYGETIYAAGTVVKVVVSALDAAGDRVNVQIELDPYAVSA